MAFRLIAVVMLSLLCASLSLSHMSSVSAVVTTAEPCKSSRAGYAWTSSLQDDEDELDTGRGIYSVFCVSVGFTCCGDKQSRWTALWWTAPAYYSPAFLNFGYSQRVYH